MRKIELLAPAGNYDVLKTAVNSGADAVYIGGKYFGARAYAENFDDIMLKEAVEYCHLRDTKIYIAVNTLIFNKEFDTLLKYIDYLCKLNIDAIIVQDYGIVKFLRDYYPEMKMHASTQMTLHNLEGVKEAYDAGIKRVVLSRELTLREIENIVSNTEAEIEVFAHGALCVSYSGQCLFSSIIGGRSGNRGRCAQPCRLKYDFIDDKGDIIEHDKHLLSMVDLCTIEHIGGLINAGIHSLKIEGRMKEKEYVASVVMSYRQAIDSYYSNKKFDVFKYVDMMSSIFNRGFSSGYLFEKKPKEMSYDNPKNKGVIVGEIVSKQNDSFKLKLIRPLSNGDGISTENGKYGFKVDKIINNGKVVDNAEAGQIVEIQRKVPVKRSDFIYKTYDYELNKSLINITEKKSPVSIYIKMSENEPLFIRIENNENIVHNEGEIKAEKAMKKAFDRDILVDKISAINDTAFSLKDIEVEIEDGLFLPVSEIKETRRRAIEKLKKLKLNYNDSKEVDFKLPLINKNKRQKCKLSFYSEKLSHVQIAAELNIDRIYFNYKMDIDNIKGIKNLIGEYDIIPAFPQILREEMNDAKFELIKLKDTGFKKILISNLGLYRVAKEMGFKICIDYNLNIFNSMAVNFFNSTDTITLSPELNLVQIEDITKRHTMKFEAIVYGKLPLMTMEYCPIKNLHGCDKKMCETGEYILKDRKGNCMSILSDGFCRIRILNSDVLMMIDKIDDLMKSGLSYLRINDTIEKDEEIKNVLSAYKNALDGIDYNLQIKNYTRGHFYRGVL
ncbi:U32 family peptidase [Thermoanaerobacterium sp. RBIITD]|uniref:DUF3656 domain-containing U32 family peptidase n=1 Tax=Thermoanaerobacterium sp. RBIITD TaxID=1550240 RepID=UPI000BB6BBD7|nr:U32 family peptidase [Thermoanaerobacterium sp. RBIITD]SNX52820.1 putative protease [Thermoanaerobacterium sp. RBIITD]